MLAFGAIEIASFLIATAIVFVVITVWILKSEVNRNIFKTEIQKLRTRAEASEREKFLLAEEVDHLKGALPQTGQDGGNKAVGNKLLVQKLTEKGETLEKENARLRSELDAAKGSLEEVYKALCEQ